MLSYKYNLKELIDVLEQEKSLDQFIVDIFKFNLICDENYGVQEILFDPHITLDSKLKYLAEVIKPFIGEHLFGFISQLVKNNDFHYYESMRAKFLELLTKEKMANYIEIISAAPLATDHLERIKNILASKLKQPVFVYNSTSKRLGGGFVVNLGSKIIDLSIQGDLEKLKSVLKN